MPARHLLQDKLLHLFIGKIYIPRGAYLIMKGAELPINTIIVLVLLLIVLIAALLFFYDPFRKSTNSADLTTAKNNACNILIGMGCPVQMAAASIPVNGFDADKDGAVGSSGDNLLQLCVNYYGMVDDTSGTADDKCKQEICKCLPPKTV
jgi:hypothetical protein